MTFIRNKQKQLVTLGHENLKKASIANLDKWGKNPDYNVCYVCGYSGSGKSTTALSMKKPGDTVIHLDAYSEPDSSDSIAIRNKKFDAYLDKNFSNWRQMSNATENGENGTVKRYSDEYWDMVDDFRLAIEEYGKQEYYAGNRVIVEGVQIADDWLSPDKSYYKDKPIVILNTTAVSSMRRAFERDRGNVTKSSTDIGTESENEYVQWYINTKDRLNDLVVQTGAKRDEEYVKSILKEICDAWQ